MSPTKADTRLRSMMQSLDAEKFGDFCFENLFLSDDELASLILQADLVVLPYPEVFNSGAALLSRSRGCPVLRSDIPLFRELQAVVGPDWVRFVDGRLDGRLLLQNLPTARALRMSGESPDLSSFTWGSTAAKTVAFYETVVRESRAR